MGRTRLQCCTLHLLVILSAGGLASYGSRCMQNLSFPGYTIPQGDIIIKEGDPLNITCVIESTSQNASHTLNFRRNGAPLPPEMINILNSTAINLYIDKPAVVSGDTYLCVRNIEELVCMNKVSVGVPPQKVTDFKCISYNYDNLTCSWTAPENYVHTNYALSYSLGERPSRSFVFISSINNGPNNTMSSFWNVSTTPPYRPVHEVYNFTLTMHNVFGNNSINELFNHFAHVLSGPPENLTIDSTTPSSMTISWVVPLSMQTFPPGVHHRIIYQCEFGKREWVLAGILTNKTMHKRGSFTLTDLPYAHAFYDIRVSLRSAKAFPNDESMWSNNASITDRTSSRLPNRPPATTPGSFEIVSFGNNVMFREVYVYWQQIPEEEKNGPEFNYWIEAKGNSSLRPVEQTHSYAKFKDLFISRSYTFYIWSYNAEGKSQEKSTVHVPSQMDRVADPLSFTRVALPDNKFELTWDAPSTSVDSYTVFTCSHVRDRPYQCSGMLNWTILPASSRSTNLTLSGNQIYQIAITANSRNSSSGMFWAPCTIIHNKNMGKMKNVWVNTVGSTFIELSWKLECSDRIGSVEGFIVYYCPIKSPRQLECKGPQANTTFGGANVKSGNITNLIPYTTYMMTVSVITRGTTYSQQSDPLYNTTNEAAPSPPRNLRVVGFTNNTISVEWEEPEAMNGVLKYYELQLDSAGGKVVRPQTNNYEFTNLLSYQKYFISVAACTTSCSPKVNANETTKMGYPSRIGRPTVDRRNDTTLTVIWGKPSEPSGNNDYYTVRLIQKHQNGNKTFEFNTTAPRYLVENCGDGGKYNNFYVSVKAVNIDGANHLYDSPWSDELENYCYTTASYIMYLLLVIVVAAVGVIGVLFTRLYRRCKLMRDVEVKLPPGLAPVMIDPTLVPWSTEKHKEIALHPPPDEELLLMKMTEGGRYSSGDSSGCSSAHDSVTSSLESGTHISSTSDSGTEQPTSYVVVGGAAEAAIAIAAIKACDVDSPPYVATGEPAKSSNPGYIPFNQTEPEKRAGYVVAGVKSANGYIPFNQSEPVRNTGYVVAGMKNCKLD